MKIPIVENLLKTTFLSLNNLAAVKSQKLKFLHFLRAREVKDVLVRVLFEDDIFLEHPHKMCLRIFDNIISYLAEILK